MIQLPRARISNSREKFEVLFGRAKIITKLLVRKAKVIVAALLTNLMVELPMNYNGNLPRTGHSISCSYGYCFCNTQVPTCHIDSHCVSC